MNREVVLETLEEDGAARIVSAFLNVEDDNRKDPAQLSNDEIYAEYTKDESGHIKEIVVIRAIGKLYEKGIVSYDDVTSRWYLTPEFLGFRAKEIAKEIQQRAEEQARLEADTTREDVGENNEIGS